MPNEQNDAELVPELPTNAASDEVAVQVKGGATDSAGKLPQQAPAPRPINKPRDAQPCW